MAMNIVPGECASTYANRLFVKLYDENQNVSKCLNIIRSQLSSEFPEVNDDFIWMRKYVNNIYESNNCRSLINEYIKKTKLELVKIEKKKLLYSQKAKIIKDINANKRLSIMHYNSLKTGYIKCLSILQKITKAKYVPNIDNFPKIIKLFYDLSTICKNSKKPTTLVYALINYMFPDLFGNDNRFIYYRINPKRRLKIKQLSPFKMNLIKILVEDTFFRNKTLTHVWDKIRLEVDRMLDNKASNLEMDTIYKIKPLWTIYVKDENDKEFIKDMARECISTQELLEKTLKKLFTDMFKDGSYKMYRHDADDKYMGLDKIKLDIIHRIVDPCIIAPKRIAYLICKDMINNYFEKPTHIIGSNLQKCIDIKL
ncbi:early protein [Murmansk poxvirus]|uniref:Protein OPG067 n=1 Tax=Murmansk poxvirus TaxID=2025359 RepID=A0A223FMR0_9POXV|nr:early protein [Murmansk poxvirus]AST09252.1 early protein [Murmansk poxvirus]